MKVHAVINGCFSNYESQSKDMSGFIEGYCQQCDKGITYLIGNDKSKKEQLLKQAPTKYVEIIWIGHYQTEIVLDALIKIIEPRGVYLFGNDVSGAELSVRFGARSKGCSAVNVNTLELEEQVIIIEKTIYSNHMQGTFLMKKEPYCISISKGIKQSECNREEHIVLSEWDFENERPDFLVSRDLKLVGKTKGLGEVEILLVAGRGVKNKESVDELRELVKKLNGQLGISRTVAMSAWAEMNRLIGVSGVIARPRVCIAVGVSGAAAFYAGIEQSDFIIAINTDEKAPIIKKADVAIVGDYRPVLYALMTYIDHKV